ncbi:hypothetical protein F5X68DRAFT_208136 [Plectosphaerella plurivora]|uniref:BZIP domain-containing protein n=1 Tax=Plectosphaerella plurivora TaxID=936078 RepID=A0A9P8VC74_9PEZI|nr:hypothetical protein F5X68DRAFT_208136 [Plectosphaerella plurivora]
MQRRRERGRLAQSAFRKRQALAKKGIETENADLKKAIAAILAEMQPGDRPELQAVIRQAGDLAGLDPVPDDTRPMSPISSSESDTSMANNGVSEATATPAAVVRTSPRRRRSSRDSPAVDIRPDPLQCYPCRQGAMAFLPFLGAGAFTFAGRVFWNMVEKHETGVHGHESQQACRVRRKVLRDIGTVSSESESEDSQLQPSVAPLRDFMSRQGVDESLLRICGPAIASATGHRHQSLRDIADIGTVNPRACVETSRTWLSPMCLERRLRNMVGDEVFAVMANPMLEGWDKSKGPRTFQDPPELIDGFIDKLSESVECLGNLGPHWDTVVFDSMFREWCSTVMGGQGLLFERLSDGDFQV